MMPPLSEAPLEWMLRGWGIFWIVGSGIAFQQARTAALMDRVLGGITGTAEDPLVTRFLHVGSVLTMLSGVGLALATAWVLLPLGLLVLSQLIYFGLKRRKLALARSEEEREEARIQPSTRNAFWLSLLILCVTGWAVWLGRFTW